MKETKTFSVSGFDRISFRAFGDIHLIQGDEESLEVEGPEDTLDHLKVEVENGELVIRLYTWTDFLFLPKHCDFTMKVKSLRGLEILGSANADCASLQSADLKLAISGSGKMDFTKIEAQNLAMTVSGSGDLTVDSLTATSLDAAASGTGRFNLKGSVPVQKISISGSGHFEGEDLAGDEVEIHISGAGSMRVNAAKALAVSISGSGEVAYRGAPVIKQRISGAGTVHPI